MRSRTVIGVLAAAAIVSVVSMMALAEQTTTGNGCPSGAHFNLNLIGMAKEKGGEPADYANDGHRIFVKLDGKTRIYLREGEFAVVDYDGTDGRAEFQLPNPDIDETPDDQVTTSEYSVYLRLRGKPGGSIVMKTVGVDEYGNEYAATTNVISMERLTGPGNNKFENVTEQLLYLYAWVYNFETATWEYLRLPLFDDRLSEYLWEYDNNGVRLAQLRFYEVPTDVAPVPTDPGTPPDYIPTQP